MGTWDAPLCDEDLRRFLQGEPPCVMALRMEAAWDQEIALEGGPPRVAVGPATGSPEAEFEVAATRDAR